MSAASPTEIAGTLPTPMKTTPWEGISEPGAYVDNIAGHLFRIPEDALKQGRTPTVSIVARGKVEYHQVSLDAFCPINKLRLLAANADLDVNF